MEWGDSLARPLLAGRCWDEERGRCSVESCRRSISLGRLTLGTAQDSTELMCLCGILSGGTAGSGWSLDEARPPSSP